MRELVVNADDLGLSPGVNSGIARAHLEGIVTSASLMVRRPAAEHAAELVQELPSLGVGLHVDLAEWVADAVRLDAALRLRRRPATSSPSREEVERQVLLFENLMGRPPDHVDSHQHAHRSEPLRSILGRTAKELRVPLRFHSRFDYFGGFYGQGREGPAASRCDLRSRLADGAGRAARRSEPKLCCHPAADLDFRSSYGLERIRELETLCDPGVRDSVRAAGFVLDSFAEHKRRLSVSATAGGRESLSSNR